MNISQAVCEGKQKPEGRPSSAISRLDNRAGFEFSERMKELKNFPNGSSSLHVLFLNALPMDLWTRTMTWMAARCSQDPDESKCSGSNKKRKAHQSMPIPTWLIWATSIIMGIGTSSDNGRLPNDGVGRNFQEFD
ncbi:hypothetical protein SBOR_3996 [Sclerotinia borealis F-4128]|uniref:Uncharacterized protein n=1 Tax=Sclerotinia borealis (strain F-4128) TaxID=1432307 RepID=W9CM42_SCLBF|nr:hypothetical protein SBOR_3996 [Sclerotinia borealis F-4128]